MPHQINVIPIRSNCNLSFNFLWLRNQKIGGIELNGKQTIKFMIYSRMNQTQQSLLLADEHPHSRLHLFIEKKKRNVSMRTADLRSSLSTHTRRNNPGWRIVTTFKLEAAGRIPSYWWILRSAVFQDCVPLFSQSWHKFVAPEGTCQK